MFRPTIDNVVIKQVSVDNQTESGIYIPNKRSNDEKNVTGEVLAVGPGKIINGVRHEMEVKVGDKVIYSNYHARNLTIDGEQMFVVKEEKILAVL
jgi:chaperonin GroES